MKAFIICSLTLSSLLLSATGHAQTLEQSRMHKLNGMIDSFDRFASMDCEDQVENSQYESQRFRLRQTESYQNCMKNFYLSSLEKLGMEVVPQDGKSLPNNHMLYTVIKDIAYFQAGIEMSDRDQWGRPKGDSVTVESLTKALKILDSL